MELSSNLRFRISEQVLAQEVHGETVLLDLASEAYFGLDEVGTRVWQLLAAGHNLGELLGTLAEEYRVTRGQLEGDVGELLASLAAAGLLEPSDETD
ncbi:MAG: PqqD family peptide modification chaperone [Xanthomonadales bacterium]|nr:PqqD family peptide modification chaperone [Xanthomonadales bacterium]NIN60465.1 PqqD family peptide modification chaperone [Xanthomonadales bacterium]NIN75818.1 PqqD family peptide modification chaperone [Xanthomonadales bacterium]NIO12996.1 PqqD family peptide modification chaperone [Xanthomonadales bacterium]NIP12858.1 PqqD family peptide modification chaperone [Xanthomonadales bacterium]